MVVDDDFASFVDIISFNQYYGWYGGPLENIKNLNWEIGIDKPVIISEFGAGALQGYHGDEQTIWSEAYQNALYRETLPTLMRIPQISGISPWILVDFRSPKRTLIPYQNGWNRKGLISETGNKKQAFLHIKKLLFKVIGTGPISCRNSLFKIGFLFQTLYCIKTGHGRADKI